MYLLFLFGFCTIISVSFGNEFWFNVSINSWSLNISYIFKVEIWNEGLKRKLVED